MCRIVYFLLLCLLSLPSYAWHDGGEEEGFPIEDITSAITYGHRAAERTRDSIDIIVVHSNYFVGKETFNPDSCMRQFMDYNVSPHYLITREGRIIRMVADKDVAWHAGESHLAGTNRNQLNASSIGIEIIATPSTGPDILQLAALHKLCCYLIPKWGIQYVVRHSDIAPGRKTDPWKMDWEKFTEQLSTSANENLSFPHY